MTWPTRACSGSSIDSLERPARSFKIPKNKTRIRIERQRSVISSYSILAKDAGQISAEKMGPPPDESWPIGCCLSRRAVLLRRHLPACRRCRSVFCWRRSALRRARLLVALFPAVELVLLLPHLRRTLLLDWRSWPYQQVFRGFRTAHVWPSLFRALLSRLTVVNRRCRPRDRGRAFQLGGLLRSNRLFGTNPVRRTCNLPRLFRLARLRLPRDWLWAHAFALATGRR